MAADTPTPALSLAERLNLLGEQLLHEGRTLASDLLREAVAALSPEPPPPAQRPFDVAALRANLHATFNGGHHTEETISAFHHGMDTVCNVITDWQNGGTGNGVLPKAEPPPVFDAVMKLFKDWAVRVMLPSQFSHNDGLRFEKMARERFGQPPTEAR